MSSQIEKKILRIVSWGGACHIPPLQQFVSPPTDRTDTKFIKVVNARKNSDFMSDPFHLIATRGNYHDVEDLLCLAVCLENSV